MNAPDTAPPVASETVDGFETLLVERIGSTLRVALNREARRNAVNDQVHQELRDAVTLVEQDKSIRAMILTGTGTKAFCSGQDLSARMPPESGPPVRDLGAGLEKNYNALVKRLADLPVPIITAINGVAAGAGMGLALVGDVILAGRSASFLVSFARIGLAPDAGVTHYLPRLIGEGRALAMALTTDPVDAETAERWGLVWQVHEDGDLQDAALAMAEKLGAMPTKAVPLTRKGMRSSLSNDLATQLALEASLQREAGFTMDYAEGIRAFLEKRPAKFDERS